MAASVLFPCTSVPSVIKIPSLNLKFYRLFSPMSDR